MSEKGLHDTLRHFMRDVTHATFEKKYDNSFIEYIKYLDVTHIMITIATSYRDFVVGHYFLAQV